MNAQRRYFDQVLDLMHRIEAEEAPAIAAAATRVADTIAADRPIHVFGTGGHSVMGAEEVFFRAGGFVPVNAILDEGVLLAHGALRSMAVERTPGYAQAVLGYHGVGHDDTLIVVNAYGVNACTIDAAVYGKEHGCFVVGVTSVAIQRGLAPDHPARHPSRHDLCDLVDVVIDCKVPMGDALVEIAGISQKVGASSTFCNALVMNLIMVSAVERLAERGIDPPIWQSGNSPGGDEANAQHVQRYRDRIKKL